jgi:hypothetical protein
MGGEQELTQEEFEDKKTPVSIRKPGAFKTLFTTGKTG